MHSLFARQLIEATADDGEVDFDHLNQLVTQAYEDEARARRRLDRAMHLMSEELEEKNAEIARQALTSVSRYILGAAYPLAVTSHSGSIIFANRMAGQLFQCPAIELAGQSIFGLLGIASVDDLATQTQLPTITRVAHDGEKQVLTTHIAMAQVGEMSYLVLSFRDETEQQRHVDALEAARVLADEANQAKSSFLAMMSHELRTPLNAMLGSADLLKRTSLDEHQQSLLSMFTEAGGLMLALVSDVLDFSKIEAGQLELNPQPMAIADLAGDIEGMWAGEAKRRGLFLKVHTSGVRDVVVNADVMRLRQIVFNLVSNGLKFTGQGGVDVRFAAQVDGPRQQVTITVTDTGIGIPEARRDSIFDAFVQADASITRQFGGTGLGLPISRSLARQMDGDLIATSVIGVGSTFTVTLNLDAASLENQQTNDEADGSIDRPLSVLVVEDNDLNRRVLGAMLQLWDTDITWAHNGVEGVTQAAQRAFDVILMDVQMPVMDGITATGVIRSTQGPNQSTPIVALTANVSQKDQASYFAAGMDLFVAKPIVPAQLMAALSDALDVRTSSQTEDRLSA
jgi:two-component system, sensor histidine kinase